MNTPLQHHRYSLDHDTLLDALCTDRKWLLIQDLDGVCMGLVRDPLRREMSAAYIEACQRMRGRFFVLTNGEHIGSRGVNGLVERAFAKQSPQWVQRQGFYLPGLAAGGVQLQDCFGKLSHPGVSEAEIAFLASVPERIRSAMHGLLVAPPYSLPSGVVEKLLATIVLDNAVSPTLNIGTLFGFFESQPQRYVELQRAAVALMENLLSTAVQAELADSFFVHLAPNLGTVSGREQLKPADGRDMGTTDFQFMLRGAVKEVGVLVLLNHYYFQQTGHFPLGEAFNARTAPRDRGALLALAQQHFDPRHMPRIVGVGDTVSSVAASGEAYQRGGSDRGFLTLVQGLGEIFGTDNAVLYVDSSGGELHRPGVDPLPEAGDNACSPAALGGITDAEDPLLLNFIFSGGHRQYIDFFLRLTARFTPDLTA